MQSFATVPLLTRIAACFLATLFSLSACTASQPVSPTKAVLTKCQEPRPELCTQDYTPVCAARADGTRMTVSNGCTACSDPVVVGYRPGECDASAAAVPSSPDEKQAEAAHTYLFSCSGDLEFVARIAKGEAWLFLPDGTVMLQQIADGLYGNDSYTLSIAGDSGLLDSGAGQRADCQNDRSRAIWEHVKLNGGDFRAVGNEPGWSLEIYRQSTLILVTDYGTQRYEFVLPEADSDPVAGTTRYVTSSDGHRLELVLSARSCRDSMSGELFSTRVDLTLDGQSLSGCGRALH